MWVIVKGLDKAKLPGQAPPLPPTRGSRLEPFTQRSTQSGNLHSPFGALICGILKIRKRPYSWGSQDTAIFMNCKIPLLIALKQYAKFRNFFRPGAVRICVRVTGWPRPHRSAYEWNLENPKDRSQDSDTFLRFAKFHICVLSKRHAKCINFLRPAALRICV
jgi:hypothetical protein